MLIKVGNSNVVNASEIDAIYISEKKTQKLVKAADWWTLTSAVYKEETLYTIELVYIDNNDKRRIFNLSCPNHDYKEVEEIRNDILTQVKELEIERISSQLESAIRKS